MTVFGLVSYKPHFHYAGTFCLQLGTKCPGSLAWLQSALYTKWINSLMFCPVFLLVGSTETSTFGKMTENYLPFLTFKIRPHYATTHWVCGYTEIKAYWHLFSTHKEGNTKNKKKHFTKQQLQGIKPHVVNHIKSTNSCNSTHLYSACLFPLLLRK